MRGLRIHLSTALVLMLLAAVFLGVNLTPRSEHVDGHFISYRGWPNVYWIESAFDFNRELKMNEDAIRTALAQGEAKSANALIEEDSRLRFAQVRHRMHVRQVISEDVDSVMLQSISRAVKNGVVGFFLIAVAGVLIEWRLRRRSGKAG